MADSSASSPPEPGSPPAPAPRRRRRWLRRAALTLLVLCLLVAFAPFALSIAPVRRFVAERVSERLGRPVTIGGITARWWTGIELRDVEVHNPEGFDGPPLVAVDRIEAHVGVLRALAGEVRAFVVVERPVVTLERLPDGRTNSDGLVRRKAPRKGGEAGEDGGHGGGAREKKAMPALVLTVRDGRIATYGHGGPGTRPEAIDGITIDARTAADGSVKASISAVARDARAGGGDGEVRASLDWDSVGAGPAALEVPALDLARLSEIVGAALGVEGLSGSVEASARVTTDADGRPAGSVRATLSGLVAKAGRASVSVGSAVVDLKPSAEGDATRLGVDVLVRALRVSGLSARGGAIDEPEIRLVGTVVRQANGDLDFGRPRGAARDDAAAPGTEPAAPLTLSGRSVSATVSGSVRGLLGDAPSADLRARLTLSLSPALGRLAGLLSSPDDDLSGALTVDATASGSGGSLALMVNANVRDLVVGGAAGTPSLREPAVAAGVSGTWEGKSRVLTLSRAVLSAGALSARAEPPFVVRLGDAPGMSGVATLDLDLSRLQGLRAIVRPLASISGGTVHAEARASSDGAPTEWAAEATGLSFAPGPLSATGYEEPMATLRGSYERAAGKAARLRVTALESALVTLGARQGAIEVRLEDSGPVLVGKAAVTLDTGAASRAFGSAIGLARGEALSGLVEVGVGAAKSAPGAAGSAYEVTVLGREVTLPRRGPGEAPSGRVEGRARVTIDPRSGPVVVDGIDFSASGLRFTGNATLARGRAGTELAAAHLEARGDLSFARSLIGLVAGLPPGAAITGTLESVIDVRTAGDAHTVRGHTKVERLHYAPSPSATGVDEASVSIEHDATLGATPGSVQVDRLSLSSSALSASAKGTVSGRPGAPDLHLEVAADGDAAVLSRHLKALLGRGYEDLAGEGRVEAKARLDGPAADDGRDLVVDATLSFRRLASGGVSAEDGRLKIARPRAAGPLTATLDARVNGGTLAVSGTCDLGAGESPWAATVKVVGLDTSPLVTGKGVGRFLPMVLPSIVKGGGSTPALSGLLDADLDLRSSSIRQPRLADTLTGPGSVRMGQGTLAESKLFAALAGEGAGKGLATLTRLAPGLGRTLADLGRSLLFSELSSRFEVGDRRIHLLEVRMASEAVSLRFDGYVGFDGKLDLKVPLELRGEAGKAIKEWVPDKTIPLHVTGTASDPTVRPDLRLENVAKNALEDLLKKKLK